MTSAGDAGARILNEIKHICVKPEALLEVRTEGCETVHRWTLNDDVILAMRIFGLAVQANDEEKVEKIICGLIAGEAEDANAPYFQDSKPRFMAKRLCTGEVEKFKEVLLIAILSGSRPLTEFILQLFIENPAAEFTGCLDSPIFPPHMTPLMIACLSNNFALVECLLLRGHTIEMPHRHDCECKECKHHNAAGRMDVKRLDQFRVVCSEAFLWLATDDPLLASIHLIEDLRMSLGFNNEHKEVYNELLNKVLNYTLAVTQHCWSFEEMDLILSQKAGSKTIYCEEMYPRALLAIENQMKMFVSHINVQSVMSLQWLGKWTDFGFNKRRDMQRIIRHGVLYPILGPIHTVVGRFSSFSTPAARFISQSAAYVILLFCILGSRYFAPDSKNDKRYATVEMVFFGYIYCYFGGFVFDQMAFMWIMGSKFYFDMWWKWIDFCICHLTAIVFILQILLFGEKEDYDPDLSMSNPGHIQVCYDIAFALLCLLATGRGLYNLQLLRNLGSTIISTGRCLGEVIEYFFIMGLVMIAFSISLNLIAQPYHVERFSRMLFSFRNLFWAFYGYLSPDEYIMINYDFSQEYYNKSISQIGMELLTTLYYMVMVISLLNLMISLLVERAHRIMENEEPEWKYTRSYIYSEYWHPHTTLPPPFNLITLLKLLFKKFLVKEYDIIKDKEFEKRSRVAYLRLMTVIFRRYVAAQRFHYTNSSLMDKAPQTLTPNCKVNFLNRVHGDHNQSEL